ncbi:LemA family protein [Planctomyces sp. SH-PL62]|uniref:LemA family protein n=1 Tax=Planctomyces sp. SH-PL62 TaxID=1636152 RepID=UPI00078E4DED|nr:LemA family protein [Planctomyces sp. SH-PL62]AMV38804.1 LemA family protein [Planctomyces sp. SH-PL62]
MFSGISGVLVVVGIVVLAVMGWIAMAYNGLVALRNRFKTAFSQIDVQLKRRYDLIPNLIETAKGYLNHERQTLEAVVQARNTALSASRTASANPGDPSSMAGLAAAETQLNGVLGRLFAVAEAYPDLKANQNMMALQQELSTTEGLIASARQVFNNSVQQYNTARESFPTNLVANAMGFAPAQLFELGSEKERETPGVSF